MAVTIGVVLSLVTEIVFEAALVLPAVSATASARLEMCTAPSATAFTSKVKLVPDPPRLDTVPLIAKISDKSKVAADSDRVAVT